jgi:hypothetical protein
MANAISLNDLMAELGSDTFVSTQTNRRKRIGNTNPRTAYRQQAQAKLTARASKRLAEELNKAFEKHGTIESQVIDAIDWVVNGLFLRQRFLRSSVKTLSPTMAHLEEIRRAIAARQLVRFRYHNHEELTVVEPHVCGINQAGELALSAWLLWGVTYTQNAPFWRMYLLNRMTDVEVLGEHFEGPRVGYNRHDRRFTEIHGCL